MGALLNQIRGVYGSIVKYLPSRAQRRYCLVIQERSGGGGGSRAPRGKKGGVQGSWFINDALNTILEVLFGV